MAKLSQYAARFWPPSLPGQGQRPYGRCYSTLSIDAEGQDAEAGDFDGAGDAVTFRFAEVA